MTLLPRADFYGLFLFLCRLQLRFHFCNSPFCLHICVFAGVVWREGGRKMRRYRRSRRGYSRRGVRPRLLFAAVLLILTALWVNSRLEPVVEDLTANEAKARAVQIISAAVENALADQKEPVLSMVNVQYNENGEIVSLSSDMAKMNGLKSTLLSGVQEELGESVHIDLGVPIGTLIGGGLLHGRGPEVPLRITLSGNIEADFESDFTTAGINQTKHTVSLRVHTTIYTFLAGTQSSAEVETSVPVAETVIVGEVPQVVANLQGS